MRCIRIILLAAALGLFAGLGCSDDDNGVNPDNNAPVIHSVTADPLTIFANQSTVATVDADDPDGDPCSCSWETHGLEMEPIGGTDNSVTLRPGCTCSEGDVWIVAIVSDGNGGTATDSVMVHVNAIE
jgi:hypothetical protein